MSLPAGTVTFLFTDIEGSTRLWEEYPGEMRVALARHDALLRQAITGHEGSVFKTVGDAFCAVFQTASVAVHAAFAAQRALLAEPWPEPIQIRVRMALHAGAVEPRDDDYFGPALNRVARLLAIGHGGQVLLSEVAQELSREALPSRSWLEPMGEHRLRDLNRPERVYLLRHADLPGTFPPLLSLASAALPNNLPLQMNSFIGREKEIDDVTALLARSRLLTLVGSGGCGKTRLALQVAADVLERYPDGVWLVELASLTDSGLVPQTVAEALRTREQAGVSPHQALLGTLKAKRLLLVLDNCEHLVGACAQLTAALLRACPYLTVLATSREALGIAGEQAYRVPSLAVPDTGRPLAQQDLAQFEAVRLFVERAQMVRPDFAITGANARALAEVCHRLDGIPFALELAAARIRSLGVEELNNRLDSRFRLLTGGDRAALPRQQTLRALVDWSYDLLSPDERRLLARLSIFAGGWTLEAAEQICGFGFSILDFGLPSEERPIPNPQSKIQNEDVLDLLTGLADKSLVIAETEEDPVRYRLLETIRQYARERLIEVGESEALRERHRDYFLTLAEKAKPGLIGADSARWLAVLEGEHDNLRAALVCCMEEPEGGEAGLRLAAALQQFWWIRGHLSEGRERMAAALAHPSAQGRTPARAAALNGAGNLTSFLGDYPSARAFHEESLAIRRELGDRQGMAASLRNLGMAATEQGDFVAARALCEESLAIVREFGDGHSIGSALNNLSNVVFAQGEFGLAWTLSEEGLGLQRQAGDRQGVAYSLMQLGSMANERGDYARAHTLLEECLGIQRELGNRRFIANTLLLLGNLAGAQKDLTSAIGLYEEGLAIVRELGDRRGTAYTLLGLGIAADEDGDGEKARNSLRESLLILRDIQDRSGIAYCLEAIAFLVRGAPDPERATWLWGAAEALREGVRASLPPNLLADYEAQIGRIRTVLGDSAFAAAWAAGHGMTWEQAAVAALEMTG